jgi:amino acid transporter
MTISVIAGCCERLATLLYIDAIVSPGGTGLLYVGTSSRISFALGRNRYLPRAFATLSARRVPALAVAFSFICGMFLNGPTGTLPFGWDVRRDGGVWSRAIYALAIAKGSSRVADHSPGRLRFASSVTPPPTTSATA